ELQRHLQINSGPLLLTLGVGGGSLDKLKRRWAFDQRDRPKMKEEKPHQMEGCFFSAGVAGA
ncbi:unnamed protein product, partial [Gulo gulo]